MELARTDRLLIRSWSPDDLDAYFDIYSRDEVTRWLGPQPRRPVADRAEAATRLDRWVAFSANQAPPQGLWAVCVGDSPIGTVLLLPLSDGDGPTGEVEVGWHLHPDAQGQGYATEATSALLDLARAAGVMEVLALTDLDNVASQAVARRLGMDDEGPTDRWFGLTTRQFRLPLASTLDA